MLPLVKQTKMVKIFHLLSLSEYLYRINRIVIRLNDVGEMLVVPVKAFFKDEISIGLDR